MNYHIFIKNLHLPSCKTCLHFKPYITNYKFLDFSLGKCGKFGIKNIVTDEIQYYYAELCRNDENKCGLKGKFYQKKDEKLNM